MFYIVIGAWLAGIVVSFINYNRKLPLTILGVGSLVLVAEFTIHLGFITIIVLALLAVIIWIANKLDMA